MTSVGDHGLSCLDDSSYAAVALSMQANANAINAALSDIQASFDSYTDRYVFSTTTSSTSSSGANSGIVLPDGTAADSIVSSNQGILPSGWYAASFSLTYQASGAVTAGTYRRGAIQISGVPGGSYPTFFQSVTVETGTGTPDSMTVNAWFYAAGTTSVNVRGWFGHGNTGSNMVVAAGATLSVWKLASGVVV